MIPVDYSYLPLYENEAAHGMARSIREGVERGDLCEQSAGALAVMSVRAARRPFRASWSMTPPADYGTHSGVRYVGD